MRFLRSNTAVIVTVGPFYDKTDGVTIETALTITNEKITLTADTDAGSAPTNILDNVTGATSGTSNDLNYITGNDAGMMQLELAAADTNRVGRMFLSITDAANHVPVFHEFFVLPQAIYDWLTGVIVPLPANMTQILGTAVSTPATAGILDTNVKNINNVAAATPGAAGGVFIAGTNAATTITTGLTTTFTGNLTGSVGSVTGAVGSVTGAVGSVTGAVGSVTGLTAATVHADLDDIQARLPAALTAGGNIKADALAWNGLTTVALPATPTNITAGTITTVTNLTNAPTAGDLTATMKTSVTTAATAATPTAAAVTGAVGSVTGNVGGNVVGSVGSVTGAVGSVTGAVGSVTGAVGSVAAGGITAASIATDAIDADALAADALAEIKAQIVAALNTDTYAESAAVPAATATLVAKIAWLATLARNKITQTATTQLVRNDADGATVGTSTVSDDGTTTTRGKFA